MDIKINLITKLCATIITLNIATVGMAIDYHQVVRTHKFDAQSMIEVQKMQQAEQESATAAKSFMGKSVNTYVAPRVSALVKLHPGIDASALSGEGFDVKPLCNNFGIVTLSADSLEALAEVEDVERISFGERKMKLMLGRANQMTGVDLVHEGSVGNGLANKDFFGYQPYTGKGVMIGIFDSGFDPNHAMFLDENGVSRFKIIKTRNSTPITDPTKIAGFTTDSKTTSHATHVSGIAAGCFKGDNFDLEGVAPKADLAMGPILNTAAELDYIKYLAEYCKERKQRLVINMSYGSTIGPHDGSDLYSETLSELVNQYDIIACLSVGNDADANIVQKHTLTSERDSVKAIFDLSTTRDLDIYVTTSNPTPINMDFVIVDVQKDSICCTYPAIIKGEAQSVNVNDANLNTTFTIAQEAIHDDLAGYRITTNNIYLENSNYRFGYVIKGEKGQELDIYTETLWPFSKELSNWSEGLTSNGTTSVESCAEGIIATGAYNSTPRMAYAKSGAMTLNNYSGDGWGCKEGDITYYSGFGTKYNNENLPSVCAPGAILESSFNRFCSLTSQKKKITRTDVHEGKQYSFCAMNGTSMASPYMAGIAALWLEADPTLTHQEIKNIAMLTADNDEACNEGNHFHKEGKQGGAGKVDAWAGLMYILNKDAVTKIDVPTEKSFLVRNTSSDEYEAFCAGAASLTATIYNMEGKKVNSTSASGNTIAISTQGLNKGIYVLKVSSNNKSHQMKIAIK